MIAKILEEALPVIESFMQEPETVKIKQGWNLSLDRCADLEVFIIMDFRDAVKELTNEELVEECKKLSFRTSLFLRALMRETLYKNSHFGSVWVRMWKSLKNR